MTKTALFGIAASLLLTSGPSGWATDSAMPIPQDCTLRSQLPAKLGAAVPPIPGREALIIVPGASQEGCGHLPGCQRLSRANFESLWGTVGLGEAYEFYGIIPCSPPQFNKGATPLQAIDDDSPAPSKVIVSGDLPIGCIPRGKFPQAVVDATPPVSGRNELQLLPGTSIEYCSNNPGCRLYTKRGMEHLWGARIEGFMDQALFGVMPCRQ